MRASLLVSGVLAASLARTASSTLLVDASKFTTVTVDAPLYDTKLSDDNGCDPSGCQGSLTRVSFISATCHTAEIYLARDQKVGVRAVYSCKYYLQQFLVTRYSA